MFFGARWFVLEGKFFGKGESTNVLLWRLDIFLLAGQYHIVLLGVLEERFVLDYSLV